MWKTISAAAMTILWLTGPVARAEPPDLSSMPEPILPQATPPEEVSLGPVFTYNATAASNYIFRGVSQTENDPALFGAARVSDGPFYAGAGIETVNFHDGTNAEYDLSAGWTPVIAGFRFDFGVIRYGYISEPAHTRFDTVDYKAAALHDFGPITLGASVFYTANFFGNGHEGLYFQGSAVYRFTKSLSVGGALGRQTVEVGPQHTTWNAGVNYAFFKHLALDLRYYDTNAHDLGSNYGGHYVVALKASF